VQFGLVTGKQNHAVRFHPNVFLPKPQTFADFKITEHREDGGYMYSFAGTPRVWAANKFESARRIYFLKHDNELFLASHDLQIRLERTFSAPKPSMSENR
jgi:hypothetical protein